MKYAMIYGVLCRSIEILEQDRYGVRIQYKVKNGRKIHKCWVDYPTVYGDSVMYAVYEEYIKP